MPKGEPRFDAGMDVRREMFGPGGAEQQYDNSPPFLKPLQEVVTSYCFGDTWSRPGLDRKTRSLMTIAMIVQLGKPVQLKLHVRGAIANGATVDEIQETLLHAMVYAGVPAGVDAFLGATEVLGEMGLLGEAKP
ncbi:carboxymuconolactone decarboxylase family protein [soil metagenome]